MMTQKSGHAEITDGEEPKPDHPAEQKESRSNKRWLIYGASGYTGRIIAEEAARRNMRPVLAGRDADAIGRIAADLNLPCMSFSLENVEDVRKALNGFNAVLHCAGPFIFTSRVMVDICLELGIHYMDLSGEIEVMEAIYERHEEAKARGIVLLPAAGFDVVPTDCLALMLKERLPTATHLRIAISGTIRQSPGTWKTTLETIPRGGKIRKNGDIVTVPHVWKNKKINFNGVERWTMSIPWGDISSAFRSTGIPNIEVYGYTSLLTIWTMKLIRPVIGILKNDWLRLSLESVLGSLTKGPNLKQREKEEYYLRGDVRDDEGNSASLLMRTPEAYRLTVYATLTIVERILNGVPKTGSMTPAQLFGSDLALTLPGVSLLETE